MYCSRHKDSFSSSVFVTCFRTHVLTVADTQLTLISRYYLRAVAQCNLELSPISDPIPGFCYCQLPVCRYRAPVLSRGRVCHLKSLLALISAVNLGFEARVTHDYILLSQIRVSHSLKGQVPVFISPRITVKSV